MSEELGRAQPPEGVVSTRSPFPVGDTVRRLSGLIVRAGTPLSAPARIAAEVAAS